MKLSRNEFDFFDRSDKVGENPFMGVFDHDGLKKSSGVRPIRDTLKVTGPVIPDTSNFSDNLNSDLSENDSIVDDPMVGFDEVSFSDSGNFDVLKSRGEDGYFKEDMLFNMDKGLRIHKGKKVSFKRSPALVEPGVSRKKAQADGYFSTNEDFFSKMEKVIRLAESLCRSYMKKDEEGGGSNFEKCMLIIDDARNSLMNYRGGESSDFRGAKRRFAQSEPDYEWEARGEAIQNERARMRDEGQIAKNPKELERDNLIAEIRLSDLDEKTKELVIGAIMAKYSNSGGGNFKLGNFISEAKGKGKCKKKRKWWMVDTRDSEHGFKEGSDSENVSDSPSSSSWDGN